MEPPSSPRSASLRSTSHGFSGRPQYGGGGNGDTASVRSRTSRIQSPSLRNLPEDDDVNDWKSVASRRPASDTRSISTKGRNSLDPTLRPPSIKADQPWIGTFPFEQHVDGSGQPSHLQGTMQSGDVAPGQRNSDASSDEHDVEKQPQVEKPTNNEKNEDEKDPNVVGWDGPNDPQNPQNWPRWRKWVYTALFGSTTFVVTFASSVFSTAVQPTMKEFGVSEEVMILGTALFVLGFAWGPPIWGPFSELYGRRPPLFIGYFIFAIFNIPVAVAQNLYTIMICRFFGGFFASAPLAIVGGILADMWNPVDRAYALSTFAGATFIGPACGPVIGGFVTQSYLGWRWTAWLTLIMASFFGGLAFLVVPETSAPRILHYKAKKIRYETKNWAIHAPADENQVNLKNILERYVLRAFTMLALEPILVLLTVYMSVIYGIIYLFFEVFPITFQMDRGLNLGVGALPFLALLLGVILGSFVIYAFTKYRFAPRLQREGHVTPEERLLPMFVGGLLMPVGLFWFAWTSNPSVSIWAQIIAIIPTGAGILIIFMQGLNYIIDVYLFHANSAIAANTFIRSWAGAGFPMFATYMYQRLGVPWATSLLAFICVACYPVPILFYIYGEKIRKLSKFSPTA
ncbi:MAG: hypothetical protein M1828_006783 [Chrysothrix sp. TS-e1954]|nr:MAG: hypothetical protein M1828_006783 [Chrysothrix sp. TS-e1954]